MSQNPYDGDTYGDTRGVEDEVGDQRTEDSYDDTWLPYGGTMYPFEWSIWSSTADEEEVYEGEEYDQEDYDEAAVADDEEDDAGWDVGVIGTLLLVGLFLFLFPEPTTSAVGIFLLAIGVGAWVVDWLL